VLTDELLQRIAVELAALNPATTAQGWPPELGEIFLPSLVLQTLVENAVKHGLAPSLTGGEIRVAITRAAGGLYLARVSNTGQPLKSAPEHGGAGLANTQARLTLLYGARHQFALAADEAGRTTASFLFTGERFD
jgi:LytS/YehU family sensor histidine kinase